MRTADEVHVVFLQESRHNIWAKREANTSIVLAPPGDVFVRVRPEKIAKQAAVRNLYESVCIPEKSNYVIVAIFLFGSKTHISRSHDATDLLHRVQVGAQSSMHGEDLLVDDGGNGQAVEAVSEGLPQLDVVSSLALVVESVNTVDRRALMVSAKYKEVLWVLDLVCE